MDLTNLAKTVANFAPLLGAVLPIPGGEAIGALIAHEFGGSDTTDPDALATMVGTDPNAKVKLMQIEDNCKVQLQQLMVQNTQAQLAAKVATIQSDQADRADARKNNANSYMPAILTFISIVGFFTCFVFMVVYSANIPNNVASVLYMMVGTINTAFGGAFTYWLGSSESSRTKDAAIHTTLANLSSQ